MKQIYKIVSQIEFYLGKAQSGYYSPETIVRELNTESLNVFESLASKYAINRKISEYLHPFLVTTDPMELDSRNTLAKPEGMEFCQGVILENDITVEILEQTHWQSRIKHANKAPSVDYPICRMIGNEIRFRPALEEKVIVTYLKKPTTPVYAYELINDEVVYDDESSIDWEWSQLMTDKIIIKTLSNLGINIKDSELIEYSQLDL